MSMGSPSLQYVKDPSELGKKEWYLFSGNVTLFSWIISKPQKEANGETKNRRSTREKGSLGRSVMV